MHDALISVHADVGSLTRALAVLGTPEGLRFGGISSCTIVASRATARTSRSSPTMAGCDVITWGP